MEVARHALRHSGSRVTVFADLVQPAMRLLGERWYAGSIRSEEERRACEIAARVGEALDPTPAPEAVSEGSTCLLATLAGERHVLGLGLLGRALEDDGWRVVVVIGVTPQALLESVGAIRPSWVGLSASFLDSANLASDVIGAIRQLHVPVLVGGQAFNRLPELWRRAGATGYGLDARVGVVMARRFAVSQPRVPATSRPRCLPLVVAGENSSELAG